MKIFCIVGTRPEFIKVFPVYKALKTISLSKFPELNINVEWVLSMQHREMIEDLKLFFEIKADKELEIPEENLDLNALAVALLEASTKLFKSEKPDLVIVQGDTLTSQQSALAAFYLKIPIVHIEAGIRTNDIENPFPEELSRRILSQISSLNFCPTKNAHQAMEAEKIIFKKKSFNFYTGNTVIDTLKYAFDRFQNEEIDWDLYRKAFLLKNGQQEEVDLSTYIQNCMLTQKRIILITAHRRENQGLALQNLTDCILKIAQEDRGSSIEFVVVMHKNPAARKSFEELEKFAYKRGIENIKFLEALNYPLFLKLMDFSHIIVTDSGGIQEEAPYLGKPVLVFRKTTERTESIDTGLAKLVGTESEELSLWIHKLLSDRELYKSMIKLDASLYGDGQAAIRIAEISLLYLKNMLKNPHDENWPRF
jgi:UDP-N-acetylglucosamine 2-epimerase (non-hydrolysing)